jgi:LDH2 family malate/lactate/ureidoglycolate dehydrogenase
MKLSIKEAEKFIVEILLKCGVDYRDAQYVADHLILAELFEVKSHGIVRLPYYVDSIKKGYLNSRPEIRIIAENSVMIHVDGDSGLGQAIAARVTEIAMEKARKSAIGFGSARNLGHVGMLSYYTFKAVKENFISLSVAGSPSVMAPLGGKKPFLGTNPISIGIPYKGGRHILFDSAMSVSSRGKIILAYEKGEKIPIGWALDREGHPTTDPRKAIEGALLPDGVKGYAISLLIDVFCGAVLGGKYGYELPANFSSQGGFAILVLDPEFFRNREEYLVSLEEYIEKLKSIPSDEEIRLPGQSKLKAYERSDHILLDEKLASRLRDLARNFDVEFNLD